MKKLFNVVSLVLMLSMVLTTVAIAADANIEDAYIDADVDGTYYILYPGDEVDITVDWTVTGKLGAGFKFDIYKNWQLSGDPLAFVGSTPETIILAANNPPASQSGTVEGKVSVPLSAEAATYSFVVGAVNIQDGEGANPLNIGSTKVIYVEVRASSTPPDLTDPDVDCTVPDTTIWYDDNVSVTCTASDAGSGLADPADASFSLTTTVEDGYETATAQTNSREVCDVAGNCVTAGPYFFQVDRKAPAILCTVPNAEIWYDDNVTVPCTSSDLGSGLKDATDASFSLSTTVSADEETATALTGSKTVYDNVDNRAVAGPYTFKVDKKAPTFGDCPAGGPFILGSGLQSVGPIEAFDYGSGIDAALSTLTGTVDTSTVGSKNVVFTAYDLVGNSETKTCSYSVIYKFGGFLQPINADGSSIFKQKSTIPVKFQLTDADGNYVADAVATIRLSYVVNQFLGTAYEDAISTSAATTGNLFRYSEDQYIFNLATKSMKTGTWQIRVDLDDGTFYTVFIGLR